MLSLMIMLLSMTNVTVDTDVVNNADDDNDVAVGDNVKVGDANDGDDDNDDTVFIVDNDTCTVDEDYKDAKDDDYGNEDDDTNNGGAMMMWSVIGMMTMTPTAALKLKIMVMLLMMIQ